MSLLEKIETFLATVGGGLCLTLMTITTVVTVFGRYVIESDLIPGGYNIIESVLMPLMVFWGLPLAYRRGTFPKLELSFGILGKRGNRIVDAIIIAIEFAVYAVVFWYVSKYAFRAIDTGRQLQIGTGLWLAWPVYIMAPISFALLLLEMVLRQSRILRN